MREEHEIVLQVQKAQTDSKAADELIQKYLPFIKSETAKFLKYFPDEGQDELSIAMFAFYEAVLSYRREKGIFLKLAAVSIKNRLIDYRHKEQRHMGAVSLDMPDSKEDNRTLGDQLANEKDELEERHYRSATKEEIQEFSAQLETFGLTLSDVADNCPKQERTRLVCMEVLDYARRHPSLLDQLIKTRKLPLAQLAVGANVDRKTLERHRRYLVAILLAYTNGFEIIRGHLKMIKRKEETGR